MSCAPPDSSEWMRTTVARRACDEILHLREVPRQSPHDVHAAFDPPQIDVAEGASELLQQGVANFPVRASNPDAGAADRRGF